MNNSMRKKAQNKMAGITGPAGAAAPLRAPGDGVLCGARRRQGNMSGKGYYSPKVAGDAPFDTTGLESPAGRGTIEYGVNSSVILKRLASEIYKDAESGLRELYTNEARACRAARREHGADPRIVIECGGSLVIRGEDSLGMSRDVYNDVYTVVARSTNTDGTENGQFGMGRLAYYTLGDSMLFETRCRNGDAYSFESVDASELHPRDAPVLDSCGTRVTVPLRDEGRGLYGMARRCARLSGVPTIWRTDSGDELLPQGLSAGMPCGDIVDISDGHIEIAAGFGCGSPRWGERREAFLARAPIGIGGTGWLLGKASRLAIHCTDEREYLPERDRERLVPESERSMLEKAEGLLRDKLEGMLSFESFEALRTSPHRRLAARMYGHIREDKADPVHEWLRVMGLGIVTSDGTKTSMMELPAGATPVYADRIIRARADAILEYNPGAVVFRSEHEPEGFAACGIPRMDAYIKEHGLRPRVSRRAARALAYRTVVKGTGTGIVREELGGQRHVIRASPLGPATELLGRFLCRYSITGRKNNAGIDASEFLQDVSNRSYRTSSGTMTGRTISSRDDILLVESDIVGFAGFGVDGFTEVLGTADELFEVAFLCQHSGRRFHTGINSHSRAPRGGKLPELPLEGTAGCGQFDGADDAVLCMSCMRHTLDTVKSPDIRELFSMAACEIPRSRWRRGGGDYAALRELSGDAVSLDRGARAGAAAHDRADARGGMNNG
ncbi:hypothetical protein CENSYa_0724 [Cenarchaeum symbiosum A]|uniref:Uncharacterized protein n=1 Tax=Cenarchaeum symbiosum (strain A) TaxID=414004 RepID=A0RVJ0_CENSY|nr:hypothetical protein CENSYa_0724 [Cenarchaeum symbiosum A]